MRPPLDYQVLLLSLADEYLDAAHSQGTAIAVTQQEREMDEYYKLIATGLGCLEAVLKVRFRSSHPCVYIISSSELGGFNSNSISLNLVTQNWRLQPRTEALVRLRYARILHEETENDLEAETALSKGV